MENRGVAPDVEIDLSPSSWRAGHDTQLETAVSMLMQTLAKNPTVAAKRPAFPIWAQGHTPTQTP